MYQVELQPVIVMKHDRACDGSTLQLVYVVLLVWAKSSVVCPCHLAQLYGTSTLEVAREDVSLER